MFQCLLNKNFQELDSYLKGRRPTKSETGTLERAVDLARKVRAKGIKVMHTAVTDSDHDWKHPASLGQMTLGQGDIPMPNYNLNCFQVRKAFFGIYIWHKMLFSKAIIPTT